MSNDIKKSDEKKVISEETKHIIANLVLTTVSTAALVISLATGMKGKRRK